MDTAAALAGRQHVAEQIDPLLQVIDQLQDQIRHARAEVTARAAQ